MNVSIVAELSSFALCILHVRGNGIKLAGSGFLLRFVPIKYLRPNC